MYKVKYTKSAVKELKKLDRPTAKILTEWVKTNLEDTDDPRKTGKSLSGNRSNQWRYRKGNYRIIADINDKEIVIHIIAIGHRKEIYRK
ncbi:type II toxin-antitoxin system RelE family toxin [Mammaliicoccus lentus]|uniref:type II toxin-antitoxin system RelE family toxin n=1 Tax=Mammaliicoccus lentus TaxID=42858 RepID=UPI001072371E|nr:type II toxin-antitoxin system RelE/ParE family toxin [Mammaliicoccus lentus]MBF0795218.1 type II toxin-antitoxin system RelE/ParE family toxin [Mammaliicoccus lentus]TFV14615.1 type II toxin-antitoxin system RelE/ParE family toxin [Mammaliicoccus lentus]